MPEDKIIKELEEFGLTSYETSCYLTLVRRPSFSAAELSRTSRVPRQRIYDVIDALLEKGLCQVETSSPVTVGAIPPELALVALGARKMSQLEGEREQAKKIAASLALGLKALYEEGQRQGASIRSLDIYRDPSQITAVAQNLAQATVKEIRLLLTGPSAFEPEAHSKLLGEALSRGVSCRALLGPEASLQKEFGNLMSASAGRGLTVRRLSGALPGPRAQIFDRAAVLLFLPEPLAGPASFQVLAIRHPEMLALMQFTFESLWGQKQAQELDAQGHTRG